MFELIYLIAAIGILYLVVSFFSLPFKILYNGIIGAISLWLLNLIGGLLGFTLEITIFNSLIAGFFGVPGVIFLILLKLM